MSSRELTKQQIRELGLVEAIQHKEILNGLAEIAAYTGYSIRTIRRAIDHHGLIAGHNGDSGKYITTKENIRIWLAQKHLSQVIKRNSDKPPFTKQMRSIASKITSIIASNQD